MGWFMSDEELRGCEREALTGSVSALERLVYVAQRHGRASEYTHQFRELLRRRGVRFGVHEPMIRVPYQSIPKDMVGVVLRQPDVTVEVYDISVISVEHMNSVRSLAVNCVRGIVKEVLVNLSYHYSSLQSLELSRSGLGDYDAITIAASKYVSNLMILDLGWNRIGDAGAQAIARSPNLRRLTRLNLNNNRIGDPGAQALAGSEHGTMLMYFNLVGNVIGVEGARAVRQRYEARGCHLVL